MRDYKPRRCSKRWLDADCPREVLAIIDHGPKEPAERYDILYAEPISGYSATDWWVQYLSVDADGRYSHGELRAHEAASYRYRIKHRYAKWSSLPEPVKTAVRRDLAEI